MSPRHALRDALGRYMDGNPERGREGVLEALRPIVESDTAPRGLYEFLDPRDEEGPVKEWDYSD